ARLRAMQSRRGARKARLRVPALLPAQCARLPGAGSVRPGQPGAAGARAGALEPPGVPPGPHRWVLNSRIPTVPAGRFRGDMVVTMRWLTPGQAIVATQVSSRFPYNHGAPIHIGDPAAIGADLAQPLFGGPVPALP